MSNGPTSPELRFSDNIDRSEDTSGVVAVVETMELVIETEDSD